MESDIPDSYYWNYDHGDETLKWFESLKKGDSIGSALEFIRNTGALIIEDEKADSENTVSEYKIYLQCYYPLETDLIDFIFGYVPENVYYSYDIEIGSENGKVTSGSMEYYDFGDNKVTRVIE